jgi:lipoate-protein ligase A
MVGAGLVSAQVRATTWVAPTPDRGRRGVEGGRQAAEGAQNQVTSRRWRLLLDFDQPGAWHMAADEALHACFALGRDRPILRLYSWSPPCLSLGYAQPVAEVDREACAHAGVKVVRRPSGGRAVLHDRELTYAVVAAVDDPTIGGGIGQSYRAIAAGLLGGLRALGVDAALAPGSPAGDAAARRSGACFAAATRHEVLWRGRKLVGSAQLRRDGVLLQHGSILLDRSRIGLAALLSAPRPETLARRLAGASATVAEATGARLDPPVAAERFAAGFAAALGLALDPDNLTAAERTAANGTLNERYATAAWAERR